MAASQTYSNGCATPLLVFAFVSTAVVQVSPTYVSKSARDHFLAVRPQGDVVPLIPRPMVVLNICGPVHPTFPLEGYGGAEKECEDEALALAALRDSSGQPCVTSFGVTPKRSEAVAGTELPIEVFEVGSRSMSGPSWIEEVRKWLDSQDVVKPDLILGVPEWGIEPMLRSKFQPGVLATQGFGNDAVEAMDLGPREVQRLPSKYTFESWKDSKPELAHKMVMVPEGFAEEEFELHDEVGDYFLWTAGCGWETAKGLDKFFDVARQMPEEHFVWYCSDPTGEQEYRWNALVKEVPNLEFRGLLPRGRAHHDAFGHAKAFFMLSYMGGETFGRTTVEALSKGTPVIGSNFGPTPENICEECGVATDEPEEWLAAAKKAAQGGFNRRMIHEWARSKFLAVNAVQQLLALSRPLLRTELQQNNALRPFSDKSCLGAAWGSRL